MESCDEKLSGESPVPPISVAGKVLDAPASLLNEDTVYKRWLREPSNLIQIDTKRPNFYCNDPRSFE